MIYFIGGPPRVGKTLLARKLAKRLNISWLSTDTLRGTVRETGLFPANHPLFALLRAGEENDQKKFYDQSSPQRTIDLQNEESQYVAEIVKAFLKECSYLERNFVLEGVALFPSFYDEDFLNRYSINFCCVGNTDFQSFSDYSWRHRTSGDWLEKADRKTFDQVIRYCAQFSQVFKQEAERKNIPYYDIRSPNFIKDVDKVIKLLTETSV